MYRLSFFLSSVFILLAFGVAPVAAQLTESIAFEVEIGDEEVADGSIVCSSNPSSFNLCTQPYLPSMHGVVTDSPGCIYR